MFSYPIKPGLEVRLYEHAHAQEVFDVTCANRDHIGQWLPWVDNVKSVDDTRDFIKRSLEQFSRDDGFQAGIWENARYVGGIGFHWINRNNNFTEIGYWLSKGTEGRGVMTASCRAMVDHAFKNWNVNKVEIRAAAGNTRSRAVPKRLGFAEEATLRQLNKIRDTYHDLVVYGMLASEWAAKRG